MHACILQLYGHYWDKLQQGKWMILSGTQYQTPLEVYFWVREASHKKYALYVHIYMKSKTSNWYSVRKKNRSVFTEGGRWWQGIFFLSVLNSFDIGDHFHCSLHCVGLVLFPEHKLDSLIMNSLENQIKPRMISCVVKKSDTKIPQYYLYIVCLHICGLYIHGFIQSQTKKTSSSTMVVPNMCQRSHLVSLK